MAPCIPAVLHKTRVFEFLFAASKTSLRFRTLLVAETLPAAGLSYTFMCFLRPAAVKYCSGSRDGIHTLGSSPFQGLHMSESGSAD